MNTKFFVALLIYIVTVVAVEAARGYEQSSLSLLIAHTTALAVSWLIYYMIRAPKLRPPVPTRLQSWLSLVARVALALSAVAGIAYAVPGLLFEVFRTPDIWMPLRLFLPLLIFIAPHILIPVAFWGILRLGYKRPHWETKSLDTAVSVWALANVLGVAAIAYAVYLDVNDPSGWSGFFTIPIYAVCAGLSIFDAAVFARRASKAPRDNRRLKFKYRIAAVLSLAPITLVAAYFFIGHQLEQAAKDRAETFIPLQETRQLVAACKVKTLSRHDNYASMELRENTPVLPGGEARPERRVFEIEYFDELLTRIRSKDVQDRCGFVSVYDSNRASKPDVKKWITLTEAETIMRECRKPVSVHIEQFPLTTTPSGPNTTGILFLQRFSEWNDDFESQDIILIDANEATKATLVGPDRTRTRTCHKG